MGLAGRLGKIHTFELTREDSERERESDRQRVRERERQTEREQEREHLRELTFTIKNKQNLNGPQCSTKPQQLVLLSRTLRYCIF